MPQVMSLASLAMPRCEWGLLAPGCRCSRPATRATVFLTLAIDPGFWCDEHAATFSSTRPLSLRDSGSGR